jgi:SAM domain (Sterile alpha motif)
MQQKLNSAMSQLSFENTPRRTNSNPPVSPSPRNSRHLDPSTIQAMFPDAAAALAHQRSLLTSNRNSINGGLPSTTLSNNPPRSPALQAAKDAWPITSTETPVATKIRPRSADLTSWQTSTPTVSQSIKSPRVQSQNVGTPSISEDLTSPFGLPGGGSWASMVNTPVVPMFQNPHTTSARGDTDLASSTAMKLAAWSANNRSSVSGGIINLDTDVRKFRRGRTSQSQPLDTLSTPTQSQQHHRGGSPTNIVMYDEHGHLMQFTPQQMRQQLPRQTSPRPTSPYPPGFQQYSALSPIGLMGGQPYLNPYDTSPVLASQEFQGYLSDQGDRRGTSPSFSARKYPSPTTRRSSSTTKQEDPLDPNLLTDIPAWLRSLRLHKYTDNLQDVKGGVMGLAQLSDQDLERRGVSAVGARRKLLKCFEQVKSGLQADTAEI